MEIEEGRRRNQELKFTKTETWQLLTVKPAGHNLNINKTLKISKTEWVPTAKPPSSHNLSINKTSKVSKTKTWWLPIAKPRFCQSASLDFPVFILFYFELGSLKKKGLRVIMNL